MNLPFKKKTKSNYLLYIFPKSDNKYRRIDYKYDLPMETLSINKKDRENANIIGNEIYILYRKYEKCGLSPSDVVIIGEDKFDNIAV